MERTSVQMTVSLPPALYRRALKVARREIRSKSELVRVALRDYIARRERFEEARHELARGLAERGLRTLADVDRMIHESRTGKRPHG